MANTPRRKKYVPAVGPKLKRLLAVVFLLFAVLTVNSVYLVAVTIWGVQYQNWFYLNMFLLHVVLGLVIVVPIIVFGVIHIRNASNRPNRRAIRAGLALFIAALIVLVTGFVLLTRADGVLAAKAPAIRQSSYWLHVLCPLAVIWLYILHRLAGRRIKWRVGLTWATAAAVFAGGMLLLQTQDPRAWNVEGPASGEQYFFPALSRTSTGKFIPERVLKNDAYCLECHADVHDQWSHSAHRFSSFNNPAYEFSIRETRRVVMERDGTVQGARFCAGCHDPVPFFTGAFDDPKYDDPDYDLASDRLANAGVTCTSCHAISHINSPRGNGDYTITEPVQYPFTFSENGFLRWVNRQLVKAKPEFHKATYLKELHQTPEFCGSCHKVHLPVEVNDYKWLRGQNFYDSFFLSGVSGQGVQSFYYPEKAETDCNGCHMPLVHVSDETNFSARVRDETNLLKTLDHMFPSANTGVVHLVRDQLDDADGAIQKHRDFNAGVMRLDLFGLRAGGTIDGPLIAPLRPGMPAVTPGETYLLETVIRTLKMGHHFTQGTSDSNEVWLDLEIRNGDRVIARSGGMREPDQAVDPWSHFVNSFVIDRNGYRINRRNAQDIFVSLYNNQIPPGAADVVHGRFVVPEDATGAITIEAKLRFRKFDTEYMRLMHGDDPAYANDLPIMTLAEDSVTLPVGDASVPPGAPVDVETWVRWNDYGIGLFRRGQLAQARDAFDEVEALGRPDGPLNLARAYVAEGLVQTHAPEALERASAFTPPANEWSVLWFGAQVAERNGDYDTTIEYLQRIVENRFAQATGRGFDFSKDYRVHVALGNALFQRGLGASGDERRGQMEQARDAYKQALVYDPENVSAHYGLKQVHRDLGDEAGEREHAALHARYKPDDQARDHAVAEARRRYPAANRAAEAVVIYDLQRSEAYELPTDAQEIARND